MKTAFDRWLGQIFAEDGAFTLFVVLMRIAAPELVPLRSTYLHVIGDDLRWKEMRALFDRAGVPWQGAAIFIERAPGGGPLPDSSARIALRDVEAAVIADRARINDGEFFDRDGRRMKVEACKPH